MVGWLKPIPLVTRQSYTGYHLGLKDTNDESGRRKQLESGDVSVINIEAPMMELTI
jgi:hypothetical protein